MRKKKGMTKWTEDRNRRHEGEIFFLLRTYMNSLLSEKHLWNIKTWALSHLVKETEDVVIVGPVKIPIDINSKEVVFDAYDVIFKVEWNVYQVLALGDMHDKNMITRIDSHCSWGQVWWSKLCDCGWQLENAKQTIANNWNGMIIHAVNQEWANMWYWNHLLLYWAYQNLWSDRYNAGEYIFGEVDPRNYNEVAKILQNFNLREINLLTNNPYKVKNIEDSWIKVNKLPTIIPESMRNTQIQKLIDTKKEKMWHLY